MLLRDLVLVPAPHNCLEGSRSAKGLSAQPCLHPQQTFTCWACLALSCRAKRSHAQQLVQPQLMQVPPNHTAVTSLVGQAGRAGAPSPNLQQGVMQASHWQRSRPGVKATRAPHSVVGVTSLGPQLEPWRLPLSGAVRRVQRLTAPAACRAVVSSSGVRQRSPLSRLQLVWCSSSSSQPHSWKQSARFGLRSLLVARHR